MSHGAIYNFANEPIVPNTEGTTWKRSLNGVDSGVSRLCHPHILVLLFSVERSTISFVIVNIVNPWFTFALCPCIPLNYRFPLAILSDTIDQLTGAGISIFEESNIFRFILQEICNPDRRQDTLLGTRGWTPQHRYIDFLQGSSVNNNTKQSILNREHSRLRIPGLSIVREGGINR